MTEGGKFIQVGKITCIIVENREEFGSLEKRETPVRLEEVVGEGGGGVSRNKVTQGPTDHVWALGIILNAMGIQKMFQVRD